MLFFAVLLAVAVVVGFVVIKKECYHGNMTSHLSTEKQSEHLPRSTLSIADCNCYPV